jgi:hypothetical protein
MIKFFLQGFIAIVALVACFYIATGVHQVRYDCRIAEISPDFPAEVKQQCREMYRQHNEQNQK